MINAIRNFFLDLNKKHIRQLGGLEIFKYIGPGLLVTVGFIDPGNWASNLVAGTNYGYSLLWIITLGTVMLIILQHNAAHLGIATGLCLSEATTKHIKPKYSRLILATAMIASISTSFAEILGGSIALGMLFGIPQKAGALLMAIFVFIMLFTNTYKRMERWIIAFVSIIGLSFIYELSLVHVNWGYAAAAWVTPSIPLGSMMIIMSVLGAVVMPHNLFLHSEVIQSRQWNLKDEETKKKQLNYEFLDTLFSMIIGWAINSAIIILAAVVFLSSKTSVTDLMQAKSLLEPLLGNNAGSIFAIALLFSGLASIVTSGMAAGSIFSGLFSEPYNIKDVHSKLGVAISVIAALLLAFVITNPLMGLIISQMILSMQLPITIILLIYLTSSEKVMGKYKNSRSTFWVLTAIGSVVIILNILLLLSFFGVNV